MSSSRCQSAPEDHATESVHWLSDHQSLHEGLQARSGQAEVVWVAGQVFVEVGLPPGLVFVA